MLKFLVLQGAPYIYGISRLRVRIKPLYLKVCLVIKDKIVSLLSVFGNRNVVIPSVLMYGNCSKNAGIYIYRGVILQILDFLPDEIYLIYMNSLLLNILFCCCLPLYGWDAIISRRFYISARDLKRGGSTLPELSNSHRGRLCSARSDVTWSFEQSLTHARTNLNIHKYIRSIYELYTNRIPMRRVKRTNYWITCIWTVWIRSCSWGIGRGF
jgi:hypothetical protein